MREDLALGERVVRDDQLREEIALRDLALLVVAREQEEQLGAKCGAAFVLRRRCKGRGTRDGRYCSATMETGAATPAGRESASS